MATRKEFEKAIIAKCKNPKVNKNGYFLNNSENLLDGIDIDLFQNDLMSGSGNELKSKFNAIFSSSALAVNNFSIVKKHPSKFNCFDYSNFDNAQFERQFRTGLGGTPPNLDFTIENEEVVIAIESKYLEITTRKKAKFVDSYNKEKLDYLKDFWFKLIRDYTDYNSYLDVAQLIKHSIGLINYKRENPEKKIILVYLYWLPDNYKSFPNFVEHKKDLIEFENEIKKNEDLKFISTTYNDFWKSYNNSIFSEHFDKMKKRYKIEI
ncbi:PGN_0703 family putative restriction endonuclease [Lacinutrix sp. MEBiC02404]